MPRRNHNAHTPRIDADELAAQARQLTTELPFATDVSGAVLLDETQLILISGMTGTGKSAILRDHLARQLRTFPGCPLTITDAKAVTSNGRD